MVIVYVPQITKRIEYIFNVVLGIHLGLDYQITDKADEFDHSIHPKINYSENRRLEGLYVKCDELLFKDSIEPITIVVEKCTDSILMFKQENADCAFDIFAASFYLISRYEEYLPFTPDAHVRFPASESLAFKNGFLHQPIVDIWIQDFKKLLLEKYPSIQCKKRNFEAVFTYDIDIAFKYAGRDWVRNAGSLFSKLLQLKINEFCEHLAHLIFKKHDPWNIYDELILDLKKRGLNSIFFFPAGTSSKLDRGLSLKTKLMAQLVRKTKSSCAIGLHPSYISNGKPELLKEEKKYLEEVAQQSILKSRQHFLKLALPETYKDLLEAGILEDYSMAFPDAIGFRASTSVPYPFFNLLRNEPTSLTLFPAACMDATFIYYLKMSADQAFSQMERLVNEVRNVGGSFISIWHNNYLAEDSKEFDWKDCHEKLAVLLSK